MKKCGFEDCGLVETPKEQKYFDNVDNFLVASNRDALIAMRDEALRRGYTSKIVTSSLTGDVEVVGGDVVNDSREEKEDVLLYGGETTVHVDGFGLGGRNRHLSLVALDQIEENELFISFASDGWDNGEHAGAIADRITLKKAKEKNLDLGKYREANDSGNFFKKTGDFILTGRTGSNVSDLMIFLKGK